MGLAHDFSNVMAGIHSLSESFLAQVDSLHPFHEGLTLIKQNSLQASQLVQRIINLHHGLLPAFPGARPYEDAHGHRMLTYGATIHFIVPELDAVSESQVVIDEVMGMLITLFLNPVGWLGAIAGFFLFRLFDVIKPYPANRLEQLHGGVGVMADDAMAAVYANLALRAALLLSRRVFG
jgi:hypothetical protein